MIAGEIDALNPGLVRKLVLVDPFGLWLDDHPSQDPFGAAKEVLAAKWHDPAAVPSPEPTFFEPDPDDPQAKIFFEARNLSTATKFMWPIADRGLRRRLPYVQAPTLVVNGASDGLVPVNYAEEFVRLIPSAELAVIDGAAHYPLFEQGESFLAAVQPFLGS